MQILHRNSFFAVLIKCLRREEETRERKETSATSREAKSGVKRTEECFHGQPLMLWRIGLLGVVLDGLVRADLSAVIKHGVSERRRQQIPIYFRELH